MKDNPYNAYFAKPFSLSAVVAKIKQTLVELYPHLEIVKGLELKSNEVKYSRVRIVHFLHFNTVNCDVYLRLSEGKFVKILNKDELFSKEVLRKYTRKEVEYLYIEQTSFENFSKMVLDYCKRSLEIDMCCLDALSGTSSLDAKVDAQVWGISSIFEIANKLGLDPRMVELTTVICNSTLDVLRNQSSIKGLLEKLIKSDNFLYQHSLLSVYIASAAATEMGWDERSTMEKLATAGILHDLSLERVSDSIKPENLEQFDIISDDQTIDRRVKKIIMNHPLDTYAMVKNATAFQDVDNIILHHHELPNGEGFPHKLSASQIPPLTCLFILAETFARKIITKEINDDVVRELLLSFKKDYKQGNFRKPLEGLLSVFNHGRMTGSAR
ncbi:MAG: HD domain-containing protein [Oligoflexia bacterium]|nr:HD domain-containing protein [Oligoflexia bacterium]